MKLLTIYCHYIIFLLCLQTEENKSVCATHTAILEALLHGSPDDVSEALESHLSRYKQSVAQARSIHPEYFIDE